MASRLGLCLILLLASAYTADALRKKVSQHEHAARAYAEQFSETKQIATLKSTALTTIDSTKLTQILNIGVGLITAFITAFTEDPRDYEYAVDTLQLQGWKLVKLFVPEEDHASEGMKSAKRAWDTALGDAAELAQLIEDAVKTGDTTAIIHSVVSTVDLALRTCAEAMPKDAKYFSAAADFVSEMAGTWVEFSTKMGWLSPSSSLVQVDSVVAVGIAPEKLNGLLTTGVGMITAMISAFSEAPPDFEYALDSLNLQGWKMIKIIVEDDKSEGMKRAKAAWDTVFDSALEITEDIMKAINDGDIQAIIRSVLLTVDTALRACAEVFVEDEMLFKAIADVIQGTSGSSLKFARAIDWM